MHCVCSALRLLAATDLVALCRWLGIDAAPASVRLSEALPSAKRHADLVAQVNAGHLAHVEFVRRPSRDLPQRMLEYRALIMGREPGCRRDAFDVVASVPDPERREELADVAAVLASIHLDPITVEQTGKEAGMPISLEGTYGGRILEARAEARGKAAGRTEGKTEGTAEVLASLLRRSFGDDPRIEAIARRMASLPQENAIEAVRSASSLDELVTAHP
jgi:hypothetical protein